MNPSPLQHTISRPRFLPNALGLALTLASSTHLHAQVVGPMVGEVSPNEARVIYRPDGIEKNLRIVVLDPAENTAATAVALALAANDYAAHFHVTGLEPSTLYTYRIEEIAQDAPPILLAGGDQNHVIRTTTPTGIDTVFTAAFISCANSSSEPVYERIKQLGVDTVVLCGDTPYVDTSVLATIRQKNRAFLITPHMAALVRGTSTIGTWDDHDFGLNNGNGISFLAGKPATRQGFVEYRAHAQYGTGTEGVYHRVQQGPMDIFLLDPRWFSQTEPSPVDPTQKTCFGAAQWTWLLDTLKQSRAPFKVLAMGQIWQDKKNTETDDLFTYWYERDALLDFITQHNIPGVVLLGGDIHVSRHLIHRHRIGYDLHDFVTSPAHTSVIASLDVYNPDLEWSAKLGRQFLTLTADTTARPHTLTARYMLADGSVLREVVIPYPALVPQHGSGIGRDLRAWWSFDTDGTNHTMLGTHLSMTPNSGATMGTPGGVRGGAASFNRSNGQYLIASRSMLPENSAKHTVSLWCKPNTLPAHTSSDRSFLLETTPAGVPTTDNSGYSLSLGFRPSTSSENINLQLYTMTLKPASAVGAAPTVISQGGFDTHLPRSRFQNRWTHVAFTFDSTTMQLFVDGQHVSTHPLPTSGPIAEIGGLIVGGHRGGTGRNYDGMIDELAIWSRVLSPSEILSLYNQGSPEPLPTQLTSPDSDNDSLPDWWENLHGLNPLNPADAVSDADGDGVAAFVEFRFGTSPTQNDTTFYAPLKAAAMGSDQKTAAYKHPTSHTVRVGLVIEKSTDLLTWTPIPLNESGVHISVENGLLDVRLPTKEDQPTSYYRYRLNSSPP